MEESYGYERYVDGDRRIILFYLQIYEILYVNYSKRYYNVLGIYDNISIIELN